MPSRGAFSARLAQAQQGSSVQQLLSTHDNIRQAPVAVTASDEHSNKSVGAKANGGYGTLAHLPVAGGGLGRIGFDSDNEDAVVGPKLHKLVTTRGGQALAVGEHLIELVQGLSRLLKALRTAYSQPAFQEEIATLQKASAGSEHRFISALGPAAARVQAPVFERFGMPEGQKGVLVMKASVKCLRNHSEELVHLGGDLRELLQLPREELDFMQHMRKAETQLASVSSQIEKASLDVRGPLAQALELPYKANAVEIAREVMKMGERAKTLADRQLARGRSEIIGTGKLLGPEMAESSDAELRKALITSFERYLQKMYQRVVTPLSSFTSVPSQWRCTWAQKVVEPYHVRQLWGNEKSEYGFGEGVTVIDGAVELPLIERAHAELSEIETAGEMNVSKDPCNPGARSKWLHFESDEERSKLPPCLLDLSLRLAGLAAALLEQASEESIHAPGLRIHPHVMAATYRKGVQYHCHKDSYDGADNQRMVSVLLYLNAQWRPGDGGEFRVFDRSRADTKGDEGDACDEQRFIDIEPLAGRLLLFRSREIWHAVREPREQRSALTLWVMAD